MKKLKEELKKVSKSLATLSKQVDKMLKQVDGLPAVKAAPKKKAPVAKKTKAAKKAPAAKKTKTAKKAPAAKKASSKPVTVLDTVFEVIKRSRKAITTAKIKEKVNLAPRQLSNALYKLQQSNKIVAISRGLYKKK